MSVLSDTFVPAAGVVLTTLPDGIVRLATGVGLVVTTLKPAPFSLALAAASLIPRTVGTVLAPGWA
jgi:hypothetical protein